VEFVLWDARSTKRIVNTRQTDAVGHQNSLTVINARQQVRWVTNDSLSVTLATPQPRKRINRPLSIPPGVLEVLDSLLGQDLAIQQI
jgi:hypothetical protein